MTNAMTLRRDSNPWYREPWPWILMAGPTIVIVAGFVTAWLAIVSDEGLVVNDYYKQGLTMNQRLQRDHFARELGLRGDLMRSGQAAGGWRGLAARRDMPQLYPIWLCN